MPNCLCKPMGMFCVRLLFPVRLKWTLSQPVRLRHGVRVPGRWQRQPSSRVILSICPSIRPRTSPALFNLMIRTRSTFVIGHKLEFAADFLPFNFFVVELRTRHTRFLGCSCLSPLSSHAELRENQVTTGRARSSDLRSLPRPGRVWPRHSCTAAVLVWKPHRATMMPCGIMCPDHTSVMHTRTRFWAHKVSAE